MNYQPEFRFCPVCGGGLRSLVLKETEPSRLVCSSCEFVFYQDPKVAACSIVEKDGKAISIKKIRASDKRWDMVGEMAVELGLIWGGTFKGKQKLEHKAHVEWHPGLPGRIDPLLLTKLLNHTGKSGENYQNVWNLLQESED